jgi:hypothetical protein
MFSFNFQPNEKCEELILATIPPPLNHFSMTNTEQVLDLIVIHPFQPVLYEDELDIQQKGVEKSVFDK